MSNEKEKQYGVLPVLTEYEWELRRSGFKDRSQYRYNSVSSVLANAEHDTKQPLPDAWKLLNEREQLEYLLSLKVPEQIDKWYWLLVKDAELLLQLDSVLSLKFNYREGMF